MFSKIWWISLRSHHFIKLKIHKIWPNMKSYIVYFFSEKCHLWLEYFYKLVQFYPSANWVFFSFTHYPQMVALNSFSLGLLVPCVQALFPIQTGNLLSTFSQWINFLMPRTHVWCAKEISLKIPSNMQAYFFGIL